MWFGKSDLFSKAPPRRPDARDVRQALRSLQKDHAPREQPKIKLREAKFLRANLIRPRQLPRLWPMATGFLRPYSASRPTLQLEWGVASARTAALCYTALVAILRELHATGSVSQLTDRLSYLSAPPTNVWGLPPFSGFPDRHRPLP